MLKGLYTAYTGMVNEQNRMDVLTNNLANASKVGYKKEGTTSQAFDEVLAYKIKDSSESPNIARKLGGMSMGVKIGENYTDYGQGSLRGTDNVYDLAIGGEGFFAIEYTNKAGEKSTKYTRDGSFTLDKEGYLVTEDGDRVLNKEERAIQLDPLKDTRIDLEGNILQDDEIVDNVQIADFADYNYLEKYDDGLYTPIEGATKQETDAIIKSGYLETANVQIVSEMVDMINLSRAYESNQKLIQTYDSTLETSVTQIGKL